MPITVVFENGTKRTFGEAAKAQWVGQGVKLYTADNRQLHTFDGPVEKIFENGEEIRNPNC